jgi:hypothetical protein
LPRRRNNADCETKSHDGSPGGVGEPSFSRFLGLVQACVLRVGVDDLADNDREDGADVLDRIVRYGEVVMAQHDKVGVLADFQRSQPALLAQEPSALDGGVAKRLLAREPLGHGHSLHTRKKRLPVVTYHRF